MTAAAGGTGHRFGEERGKPATKRPFFSTNQLAQDRQISPKTSARGVGQIGRGRGGGGWTVQVSMAVPVATRQLSILPEGENFFAATFPIAFSLVLLTLSGGALPTSLRSASSPRAPGPTAVVGIPKPSPARRREIAGH